MQFFYHLYIHLCISNKNTIVMNYRSLGNEDFWNIIDMLKKEGAEDILVCPIEKMVL